MTDEPNIDAHTVTVEELCKRFNTNVESGLNKEQVAESQKEHGPNQLPNEPEVPIWVRLCCFCFYLDTIKEKGFSYGPKYQENRAGKTRVRRNGSMIEISAGELTLGDIVELKAGDLIPADVRVIKSDGFRVDESSLTGESEPKTKKPEFSHNNPLETQNLAFFGTRATDGSCIGVVYNIGLKTVYGRISGLSSSF